VHAMSVWVSWRGRGARAGRVSCEKSTTGRKNRPRGTSDFPGRFLYIICSIKYYAIRASLEVGWQMRRSGDRQQEQQQQQHFPTKYH